MIGVGYEIKNLGTGKKYYLQSKTAEKELSKDLLKRLNGD